MRRFINAERTVNEIKQMRSSLGQDITFLIVEGGTDNEFFRKFALRKRTQILVTDGKKHVIQVMRKVNAYGIKGVVGVVDLDLDRVMNQVEHITNLYTTDDHDIEVMALNSPAYDELLSMLYSINKVKELVRKKKLKDHRDLLFDSTLPIGLLRWYSARSGGILTFDLLYYEDYFDDDLNIREPNLVEDLFRSSGLYSNPPIELIADEKTMMEINCIQPIELCNGHDACAVLKCWYDRFGNNSNGYTSKRKVWSLLLNSYTIEYFEKTKLFASLKEWQAKNSPFCVL